MDRSKEYSTIPRDLTGKGIPAHIKIWQKNGTITHIEAVPLEEISLDTNEMVELIVTNGGERSDLTGYGTEVIEPEPEQIYKAPRRSGCFKEVIKIITLGAAAIVTIAALIAAAKSLSKIDLNFDWDWNFGNNDTRPAYTEETTIPTQPTEPTEILEDLPKLDFGLRFEIEEHEECIVSIYHKSDNPFLHHLIFSQKQADIYNSLVEDADNLVKQLVDLSTRGYGYGNTNNEFAELENQLFNIYEQLASLEQQAKQAINQLLMRSDLSPEDKTALDDLYTALEAEKLLTSANLFAIKYIDVTTTNVNTACGAIVSDLNQQIDNISPNEAYTTSDYGYRDPNSGDAYISLESYITTKFNNQTYTSDIEVIQAAIQALESYSEANPLPSEYAANDFLPKINLLITSTDSSTERTTTIFKCTDEPIEHVIADLHALSEKLQPSKQEIETTEETISGEELAAVARTKSTPRLGTAWDNIKRTFKNLRDNSR